LQTVGHVLEDVCHFDLHRIRFPVVPSAREREFFIDNLLVQIHFIVVMFRWTGLAPWEFDFPFSGSLTSTFLAPLEGVIAGHGHHLKL